MNKTLKTMVLVLLLQVSAQAQQRFKLNEQTSRIFWKIETVGKHNGYMLLNSGILNYSAKGEPVNGNFVIDTKSIKSTDNPDPKGRQKNDEQLASPGFINSVNFPTSTMVVKQIARTNKPNIYRVTGDLTIKGITNAVTFDAQITKTKNNVTTTATFKIARAKWEIDFKPKKKEWSFTSAIQDAMIDDDIEIKLELFFSL